MLFLASVYTYSALHKINPEYPQFSNFLFPFLNNLGALPTLTIITELTLGLGLIYNKTKWLSFAGLTIMHIFVNAILILSKSSDIIVYPWSALMLAMIAKALSSHFEYKKTIYIKIFFIAALTTPILSFFLQWPIYLAHGFYTGNTGTATLEASQVILNSNSNIPTSSELTSPIKIDINSYYLNLYKNTILPEYFVYKKLFDNICKLDTRSKIFIRERRVLAAMPKEHLLICHPP